MKLHVSFAISLANGCRYCTLHQVLGLRRLGIDPAKLAPVAKDDSALTPRELTAVAFARKIKREPAKLTKDDYAALVSKFKEQGALEVLLQSCNFAYMNRGADGLRLPSEDEAIKTYQETYGKSFEKQRRARKQAADQ
jgi:AhpD family alkylhydroperoxidase